MEKEWKRQKKLKGRNYRIKRTEKSTEGERERRGQRKKNKK